VCGLGEDYGCFAGGPFHQLTVVEEALLVYVLRVESLKQQLHMGLHVIRDALLVVHDACPWTLSKLNQGCKVCMGYHLA
jgi:hypothetical protein